MKYILVEYFMKTIDTNLMFEIQFKNNVVWSIVTENKIFFDNERF